MEFSIDPRKLDLSPDIRKLQDMLEVCLDRDFLKDLERQLYFMYRDLAKNDSEKNIIEKADLRYDITIIPAGQIGREFVKTAGHYHPLVEGEDVTYPEVYQVLSGSAHYLLQEIGEYGVKDIIWVEAEEGDIVVIPPNYGHVTINASDEDLVMANWVSRKFNSEYEKYRENNGAAYYELAQEGWMPNKKYEQILKIQGEDGVEKDVKAMLKIRRMPVPDWSAFGLVKNEDMYNLVGEIDKLDFLNKPSKHTELFKLLTG